MSDDGDPRESPLHPRLTRELSGHGAAERRLIAAFLAGKLHHAWLIAGPRGIGKATLAYRFARFVLANPDPRALAGRAPEGLAVDERAMAAQLVAARSHPDLTVLERTLDREGKRLKTAITAEDARGVSQFFSLTPAMGGFRICIVDSADDLNPTAANALLKILEEPPERALFLLISHAPGRLLPTIRSRCITLQLSPLSADEVIGVVRSRAPAAGASAEELSAIAELAEGSPGRALELISSEGARLFLDFRALAEKPSFDRRRLFAIADALQKREALEDFHIFSGLLTDWIGASARRAALAGEGGRRPHAWAAAHQEIGHSIRRANTLNLDRRQLLLEAFQTIEDAGRLAHS